MDEIFEVLDGTLNEVEKGIRAFREAIRQVDTGKKENGEPATIEDLKKVFDDIFKE